MRRIRLLCKTIVFLSLFGSLSANAVIIFATDFNGRQVSGPTASELNWTYNGISEPGDLSADFDLYTTPQAADLFVVDTNIVNESPWTVDLEFNVLTSNLTQLVLTLDAFIYSNWGVPQTVQRNLDLTATLFDSSNVAVGSVLLADIYAPNGNFLPSFPNGSSVTFDFSGVTLWANNAYTLRLFAEGQGQGNNAGFDNLTLTAKVPEASSLLLLSFGLLLLRVFARPIRHSINQA